MTTQIDPETDVSNVPADWSELLRVIQRPCGCCAVKETDEEVAQAALWNAKQHARLLDNAIETLDRIPNNREWAALYPAARRLVALMNYTGRKPSGVFYDGIRRGLVAADEKPEYTGIYLGEIIYYMHFYDSKTRQSYFPGHENARTECEKYFNQVIPFNPERATPQQLPALGFSLGLSLHYLTDVTQPMHAVNFTNGFEYRNFSLIPPPNPFEFRHKSFEDYADDHRFNVSPGRYEVAQLDPVQWGGEKGAGEIIHYVSACSRGVYDNWGLRELVDSKWPDEDFGEEADPHILRALDHGIYHTAMFLLYYAQKAARA
jgi:hypothetical protein